MLQFRWLVRRVGSIPTMDGTGYCFYREETVLQMRDYHLHMPDEYGWEDIPTVSEGKENQGK